MRVDGQYLIPEKKPVTRRKVGCVGLGGLSRRVRKILLLPESEPWTSQPVASGYTGYAIPVAMKIQCPSNCISDIVHMRLIITEVHLSAHPFAVVSYMKVTVQGHGKVASIPA